MRSRRAPILMQEYGVPKEDLAALGPILFPVCPWRRI
jgi:hypothetical protein